MAEGSGNYDWKDRMRRLEDSIAANREDHQRFDRDLKALRASMVEQKKNVDNLVAAIRRLIDRIPPRQLRQAVASIRDNENCPCFGATFRLLPC